MTDNYPTQPLNTRPKVHDNTAVDEWLKDNKPTVLPAFERIAPRRSATTKQPNRHEQKYIAMAERIINKLKFGGVSKSYFNKQYGKHHRELKRVFKQHFGLTLTFKSVVTSKGKQFEIMELTK